MTPLHYAADRGHVAMLRYLLDNGADKSIKVSHVTGYKWWSTFTAHTSITQDEEGQTAYQLALPLENEEVIKILS